MKHTFKIGPVEATARTKTLARTWAIENAERVLNVLDEGPIMVGPYPKFPAFVVLADASGQWGYRYFDAPGRHNYPLASGFDGRVKALYACINHIAQNTTDATIDEIADWAGRCLRDESEGRVIAAGVRDYRAEVAKLEAARRPTFLKNEPGLAKFVTYDQAVLLQRDLDECVSGGIGFRETSRCELASAFKTEKEAYEMAQAAGLSGYSATKIKDDWWVIRDGARAVYLTANGILHALNVRLFLPL